MRGIFVTGTDTGVGKTIVTGFLAKYLLEKGYNVITQKWVQTGSKGFSSDVALHLKIMGQDKNDIKNWLSNVSPYTFRLAASPHLASKIEDKRITPDKIIKSFKLLSNRFDFVIVEGVGGLLVPFNKKHFLIDIANHLHLPVLIVAQNKLGAINHTLLTIEALNRRKMKILGIVFNNIKQENLMILEDNPRIIKSLTKQNILGVLPRAASYRKLYPRFIPIAKRIFKGFIYG